MEPRTTVQKMQQYGLPGFTRKGFLRLDFNENTAGLPAGFERLLSEIPLEELSKYPEYFELEKAIAEYACVENNQVLACNGSDSAIKIIFDCFVERGKKAIIPWPSFSMYEICAECAEAQIKKVLFGKGMIFPVEQILQEINCNAGIVVLCNPNNPSGTIILGKDIKKIVEKARLNNAIVLIDEANFEFYGKTSVPLLKEFENVVITRTFSKAFGLAGLRLGYLISTPENVLQMRKVSLPFEVNCIAEKIAQKALKEKEFMLEFVREVKKAKRFTENALKKMGIAFFPSKSNCLLANFGEKKEKILKCLKEKGILLRDRSGLETLNGCVRITIGTKEQMQRFIKELENILEKPLLAFDIDGVLIDVSNSYRRAIQETVEFFSWQKVSPEEIQAVKIEQKINNDWIATQKILKQKGFDVSFEKVVEKFQEVYLGKNSDGAILNEKFLMEKELLRRLAEKAELRILTGRPKAEAEFALQNFGVRDCFSKIVCLEDCNGKEKPDPFGLQLLAKEFNAKSAFYFGDTLADIECAKRAGFVAIGVLPPQDKSKTLEEKMLKEGAKIVLRDINEIEKVVK